MLFCIGFLFAFLMGGVTGIMLASPPIDFFTHDTYFVVAHFHQVLFGHAVFAGFAGLYYWYPKMFGRMLRREPGQVAFLAVVLRLLGDLLPQYVSGSRHAASGRTYPSNLGWEIWNDVSTVGAFIIAASSSSCWSTSRLVAAPGAGGRQPLGRPHARVVHHVAAPAPQLHPPASDPLGAADLGLQPP